jgi:hypothetical protein
MLLGSDSNTTKSTRFRALVITDIPRQRGAVLKSSQEHSLLELARPHRLSIAIRQAVLLLIPVLCLEDWAEVLHLTKTLRARIVQRIACNTTATAQGLKQLMSLGEGSCIIGDAGAPV